MVVDVEHVAFMDGHSDSNGVLVAVTEHFLTASGVSTSTGLIVIYPPLPEGLIIGWTTGYPAPQTTSGYVSGSGTVGYATRVTTEGYQ